MHRRGGFIAAFVLLQALLVVARARAGATASQAAGAVQPLLVYRDFILPAQVTRPTPLMLAAARRDLAKVRSLLAHKSRVDTVVEGRTALMVAAAYGDPRIVRQLLAAGARVDRRDDRGQSALFYAIRTGQRPAVEALLAAGADPNLACGPDPVNFTEGWLPLTLALQQRRISFSSANRMATYARGLRQRRSPGDAIGYYLTAKDYVDGDWDGILEALLGKGADPNRKDPGGRNALFLALREHDTAWVERLRRAGAKDELLYEGLAPSQSLARAAELCDPQQASRSLSAVGDPEAAGSALYAALRCPDLAVARLLLDKGVGKQSDRMGFDAFTSAALSAPAAAVKLLLDRGADPNATAAPSAWEKGHPKDDHGQDTALILAVKNNKDPEVVPILLAAGADPNRRGVAGNTALYAAACHNQIDAAKLLLEHGADPNLRGRSSTPLLCAASLGDLEIAKLLLAYKADVNAVDADGNTPLLSAVYAGNAKMVRLLLDAGADPGARNARQQTALDAARERAKRYDDKEIREAIALLEKRAGPRQTSER